MSLVRTFSIGNSLRQTYIRRLISSSSVKCTKENIKTDDDENRPIKYTRSPAMRWQAKYSRVGKQDTRLWYEPYVLMASISVFLIYFCILREESDIDTELNKTIYQRIPGLEEQQLYVLLEHNTQHGKETKDVISRLEELEAQKSIEK